MPVDYSGDLANGYTLIKTSSISYAISPTNRSILLNEYITGINAKGNIIFGKIGALTPDQQRLVQDDRHPGYFIVDTNTGSFVLGLEEQEWLEELSKAGISEPILRRPSSFRDEPALITALRAIIWGKR